jgi:hypothetical protein
LPLLQVSSSVKVDVQNATNAGLIAIIPSTEVTLNNWIGTGYIAQNPDTLEATYRISGGINGGSTTGDIYCYTCGCPVLGDWARLLDEIDSLLSLADVLLLGRVDMQPLADEICMLLSGIDPSVPGSFRAENILQEFEKDAAIMALSIAAIPVPIWTGSRSLIRWVIMTFWLWILTGNFPGKYIPQLYQYSGYFIMHYLYEYTVLFRAGLIDAFPENF